MDSGKASGAAGSVYVPVDLANTSGRSCTLYGYPGISFVAKPGGSQIGPAASRVHSATPATVTLAPHAVAHATLRVADAGNYDASACKPVTAHWLRVYPPGQYTATYVGFTSRVCSNNVSQFGAQLSVYPVKPGVAG